MYYLIINDKVIIEHYDPEELWLIKRLLSKNNEENIPINWFIFNEDYSIYSYGEN